MVSENLTGRVIAGYQLLACIGEGGTATVYRAHHAERGRAAVKVLRERLRNDARGIQRFLREAGYGARVQHPAVVQTYDFGQADGVYYLALEWADGEPLSEYVRRRGRLAPALVAHVADQLADGLSAAHAVGIIHRDLKPENVMYHAETGGVKLLDFGIARDAQLDPGERLTRTGFFVGTLHYVAPEALSGALVSEAADIYSLATITYYLLTARHPYTGRSPRELFQKLLTEPAQPLHTAVPGLTLPRALADVVMRGLERDPAGRQQTVRQFADHLLAAVRAADCGTATPPTARPGGRLLDALRALRKTDR